MAATALLVGGGIAAAALVGRAAIKAAQASSSSVFKSRIVIPGPAPSNTSKFPRGGFDDKMSKREAALILGVREQVTKDKLKEAHRRIMLLNHPDRGGSPYLASEPSTSLYALNLHLDQFHGDTTPPNEEDDDPASMILNWFRKTQQTAAKTFAPITQKATESLDKLDKIVTNAVGGGFELNNGSGSLGPGNGVGMQGGVLDREEAGGAGVDVSVGDESSVTRRHWQRESVRGDDVCSHPQCKKILGGPGIRVGTLVVGTGKQNCRKCGRIFCDAHTNYQMRLNPSDARHEPVNGIWCRVCEACFIGREGYMDTHGVSRKWTSTFFKLRKGKVDQLLLESNKLEKRFEKLSMLYATEAPQVNKRSSISSFSTLTGFGNNKLRSLEQSIVAWEDDRLVPKCPECQIVFTAIQRRSHCRLCGRVICGNDTCSGSLPLLPYDSSGKENVEAPSPGEVKACLKCSKTVLRRRLHAIDLATVPIVVKLYESMAKYKAQAEEVLPKFNSLVMTLGNREVIKSDDREYIMAARYRKNLMDYFSEIEKIGKRIKTLEAKGSSSQKLQDNIHASTIQYLQSHMFTLHLMPKVTPTHLPPETKLSPTSVKRITLEEIQRVGEARKGLEALEEQEAQLRKQVEEAVKRRRLEDAQSLKEALGEVEREVGRLRSLVRKLEEGFEGGGKRGEVNVPDK
ncbi:carboxypeptidase Y-deficient [Chytridiales sp. JEL 0842]|nr:carboxypeptidase Y-deficient [Chytridiales sp. JEL 0842]